MPSERETEREELIAKMRARIATHKKFLLETAPECSTEQKHLDKGSTERVYWHYGYMVALRDILRLMGEPDVRIN